MNCQTQPIIDAARRRKAEHNRVRAAPDEAKYRANELCELCPIMGGAALGMHQDGVRPH